MAEPPCPGGHGSDWRDWPHWAGPYMLFCPAEFTVPGPEPGRWQYEGSALQQADRILAARAADPGYREQPVPDWRADVTDEEPENDGNRGDQEIDGAGGRVRGPQAGHPGSDGAEVGQGLL